jgi:uncharacterized protein YdbL (DUF1318 family)
MNLSRLLLVAILTFAAALAMPMPASLASDGDDAASEALDRMRERHPALRQAKDEARIGETWQGLVARVPGRGDDDNAERRAEIDKLITDENADRRVVFRSWARRTGATLEQVIERFRQRMYNAAQPEHWLTQRDGKWVQKKDYREPERDR